jgi:hypothetical protein
VVKIFDRKLTLLALFVSTLFLAACSARAEENTIAQAAESVQQSESPASDETLLAETYTFPGFGFSIDYPT